MQFAFIFPGQGSQTVGMLSHLVVRYPDIKETFYEASEELGYDLWSLIQQGPAIELNKTWKAQPALFTASIALWKIWKKEKGKSPLFMAGHSLGEYSALTCAGVISFLDGLRLVEKRGKLMQNIMPKGTGAMSAIIGLDAATIMKVCQEVSKEQVVMPANYNSFDQIVISGHKDAVDRVNMICKLIGAKRVILLPINVASHCILMKPAAEKLAIELKNIAFKSPIIPVINNVDVKCETEPEAIQNALVRQLYNPIQWTKIIEYLASKDIKHLYEVGPGRVLTNLTKRIINSLTASSINELDVLSTALKI